MDDLPVRHADNGWWDVPRIRRSRERRVWQDIAQKLLEYSYEVPEQSTFTIRGWASDAYIGLGELATALDILPQVQLGHRSSGHVDSCFSLKYALDLPVEGMDIAILFGPKLTEYGRDNIEGIVQYLDIRLHHLQAVEGKKFLKEWGQEVSRRKAHQSGMNRNHHEVPTGMSLFSGHESYVYVDYPEGLLFSHLQSVEAFCAETMRDAENTFREERELPRVGEGWISETKLYYEVKEAFADEDVIQHSNPGWLDRQHLDVYLPARGVALEFQGIQHDRPVAFFGGEKAFRRSQERDRRKLNKCRRHNIRIIYVREGCDLAELVDQIRQVSRA